MLRLRRQFKHQLDTPERTMEHASIIRSNYFLRRLYESWYQVLFNEVMDHLSKKIVELGSGGGFLKELAPHITTSDFLNLPTNDLTFSALEMPFPDGSLDAIFMIDTFHHLPDVQKFLSEANRTLKSGGKLIMIEPANTRWGRWIYQNFHHEPFDPKSDWLIPLKGPLSGANGALPWIVFHRDRRRFEDLFPELHIEKIQYHTPFRYLLSGGLTFNQLLPDRTYRLVKYIDEQAAKWSSQLSMFMSIVLQKNG